MFFAALRRRLSLVLPGFGAKPRSKVTRVYGLAHTVASADDRAAAIDRRGRTGR